MKTRWLGTLMALIFIIASCSSVNTRIAAEHVKELPEFNKIVLKTVKEYPADGTHGYWWPRSGEGSYDGGTQDMFLQGEKVMEGEPKKRSFCCGLTLEVFLKAYKEWLKDNGGEKASVISPEDWGRFQSLWFVQKLNGPGPSAALEEFNLGRTIQPDQALPGDFVQIWRTVKEEGSSPSGHSVIFLGWEKDEGGNISGMRYWSTQPGSDGISERVEYFGPNGGIAGENTWIGRVEPRAKKVEKAKPEKKEDKNKEKTDKENSEKKDKKQ